MVRFYRSSGAGLNFQGSPPHPARATPGPPSPSRRGLEPLIRQGLWPCHLPRGGRRPPAGDSYPLLGEGGRAVGPDGCGAGRRTDLLPPLFRRIPCPLLLGEGGPAGPGVEGTPTGSERTGIKRPPPGGRLPPRGRWHAVRRDG